MLYKFWEENGRIPVLFAIHELKIRDKRSGESISKHLQKLEKYPYEQLVRHRLVKKLKGKNPLKLHELRLTLPDKYARIFFTIKPGNIALLLHLIVKKTDETPTKDIQIAEARARDS